MHVTRKDAILPTLTELQDDIERRLGAERGGAATAAQAAATAHDSAIDDGAVTRAQRNIEDALQ